MRSYFIGPLAVLYCFMSCFVEISSKIATDLNLESPLNELEPEEEFYYAYYQNPDDEVCICSVGIPEI